MRNFNFIDDIVRGFELAIKTGNKTNGKIINLGSGFEISIKNLALLISKVVGYEGKISFDTSKPDGTLRRVLDSSRLNKLGWNHKINLEEGLESTYKWFKLNEQNIRSF